VVRLSEAKAGAFAYNEPSPFCSAVKKQSGTFRLRRHADTPIRLSIDAAAPFREHFRCNL
jgi:hypothetical protein